MDAYVELKETTVTALILPKLNLAPLTDSKNQ